MAKQVRPESHTFLLFAVRCRKESLDLDQIWTSFLVPYRKLEALGMNSNKRTIGGLVWMVGWKEHCTGRVLAIHVPASYICNEIVVAPRSPN